TTKPPLQFPSSKIPLYNASPSPSPVRTQFQSTNARRRSCTTSTENKSRPLPTNNQTTRTETPPLAPALRAQHTSPSLPAPALFARRRVLSPSARRSPLLRSPQPPRKTEIQSATSQRPPTQAFQSKA